MHNFEVLGKAGEGSFSEVFKVRRRRTQKVYALKRMQLKGLTAQEQRSCLHQVRLLSHLQHPNIIGYKQAFFESQYLYLVMEWAQNQDFEHFLRLRSRNKQPLNEQEVCGYARQMVNGLAALHRTNILHRDVKAANFFLSQGHKVKLGDMNVSAITKTGMANTKKGTPFYLSPQIWLERPYSFKSDVWSLGCLLYQMVTFNHPFTGRDICELKSNVINGRYQPLSHDCPQRLVSLIEGCLTVNPDKRLSTQELLQNSYLRQKYREFKHRTMEKGTMNQRQYKMACRRILREITQQDNCINVKKTLPKSNYTTAKKTVPSSGTPPLFNRKRPKVNSVKRMTPRMMTVFHVYHQQPPQLPSRTSSMARKMEYLR